MIYIGIDPGNSGAIVARTSPTGVQEFVLKKGTEADAAGFLRKVKTFGKTSAMIEKVSAMPKQGVTSMFNFGRSYGFLRGLLVALQIPFEEVTPSRWQKDFGLLRGGKDETNTKKKNRHKAKAQELFPRQKITHGNADALLIAHFCSRHSKLKPAVSLGDLR